MKTTALIVSLAALALGTVFAVRERAAALRAAAELAEARRTRDSLDASIRRAASRARGADTGPSSNSLSLQAGPAKALTAPANSSDAAAMTGDAARAKLRESYLKSYRDSLDATMALLFARLHLTPAQADALKDLLVQREADNLRMDDLTQAAGLEDSSQDPALNALDDQLSDANKAAMRDLLGRQGERTVRAFLLESRVMPVLDMIGGDAAAAGVPLSTDQAGGLLDLLAGASEHAASGRVLRDSIDWGQVSVRGPAVLSPAQLALLPAAQAEIEATDRVRRMVVALNGQAAGLGP